MFDAKKTKDEIVKFIRDYYQKYNLKGAVIGISGGKDSAVVAALFTEALGNNNVEGVWLPCHSKENDKKNAVELSNHFGFKLNEFDLTDIYDNYVKYFNEINKVNDGDLIDANINIKPRLRMSTLYYYAAYLTKHMGGAYIVPGTSNKCEIYVGYFTKGGDNVADIQVLADLTVDEVIAVGLEAGVPKHIVLKTPDDGLSGKTDEEKLGVKYKDIADVIKTGGKNILDIDRDKIYHLHKNNMHKFNTPTYRKEYENNDDKVLNIFQELLINYGLEKEIIINDIYNEIPSIIKYGDIYQIIIRERGTDYIDYESNNLLDVINDVLKFVNEDKKNNLLLDLNREIERIDKYENRLVRRKF